MVNVRGVVVSKDAIVGSTKKEEPSRKGGSIKRGGGKDLHKFKCSKCLLIVI